MLKIFSSATKTAFLVLVLGATIGFFMDKVSPDQYIGIVGVAMAFYYKGSTTTTDSDIVKGDTTSSTTTTTNSTTQQPQS